MATDRPQYPDEPGLAPPRPTGSEGATPPPRPAAYSPSSQAALPRRRGLNPVAMVLLVSAIFFAAFVLISGGLFFARYNSTITGGKSRGSGSTLFGSGSVGVIELNGVIMDSRKTLKRLEEFEENSEIKAVVLRLNSPGGSVAPS